MATGPGRILVVSAGFYYDARLLKALAEQTTTTALVDSAPPPGSLRSGRIKEAFFARLGCWRETGSRGRITPLG